MFYFPDIECTKLQIRFCIVYIGLYDLPVTYFAYTAGILSYILKSILLLANYQYAKICNCLPCMWSSDQMFSSSVNKCQFLQIGYCILHIGTKLIV